MVLKSSRWLCSCSTAKIDCTDDGFQQRFDCVAPSEKLLLGTLQNFCSSSSRQWRNFLLDFLPLHSGAAARSSSCRPQAIDAQQLHPATSRRSSSPVRSAPPTLRRVFVRRTWSRCESSGQTGLWLQRHFMWQLLLGGGAWQP